MLDVCDALRKLLEPGDDITHDDSGSMPNEFTSNTIYAWPNAHRLGMTGTGEVGQGEWREDFEIRAVFVVVNVGEEPEGVRSRDVTMQLDARASQWARSLARGSSLAGAWDAISFVFDHDFVRQLSLRGISVLVTGHRLVSP